MSNEASRKAFEAWAELCGFNIKTWPNKPNLYKYTAAINSWAAWQASRKALEAEQAQAVEPVGYWLERAKELVEIFEDAPSFSDVASKISVKQPLSTERAELVAELRTAHAGHSDEGPSTFSDAADMLEADVTFIDEGNKAQQVAVPAWKAEQQEPIPHSGADEMPPIFGRRWRLARDGFGLQRDDESGNYVHVDDAISTMHAMLSAAPQPPQGDTK